MILLDAFIEVGATAMRDLHPERLADRSGIRVMAISCHPLWYLSGDVYGRIQEAFRGVHITVLTQHRIDEIAVTINGPIQLCPHTNHVAGGFVAMPGAVSLALADNSQFVSKQRSEARFPVPHGLMRKYETSLQKHFRQITQAYLVAHMPEHHQEDDMVGYARSLKGVLVRSLKIRRHVRH